MGETCKYSIPGLERFPGEGKGHPLQYSGLEKSMDCTVHGVAKSRTRLSDSHYTIEDKKINGMDVWAHEEYMELMKCVKYR